MKNINNDFSNANLNVSRILRYICCLFYYCFVVGKYIGKCLALAKMLFSKYLNLSIILSNKSQFYNLIIFPKYVMLFGPFWQFDYVLLAVIDWLLYTRDCIKDYMSSL